MDMGVTAADALRDLYDIITACALTLYGTESNNMEAKVHNYMLGNCLEALSLFSRLNNLGYSCDVITYDLLFYSVGS